MASVLEAEDGVEAVERSRRRGVDVVVLDLNMPRLDGVEAALWLCSSEPSHGSRCTADPELLRQRAAGLGLPLVDKVDFERPLKWVERQATERDAGVDGSGQISPMARKVDLCCSQCGCAVVCRRARTLPDVRTHRRLDRLPRSTAGRERIAG